jgi:predicted NBD/HSP70 family sugar kinase
VTTRSAALLRVAHAHPGITRADAARLVGVGTGAATEIVARLGQAALLAEIPAARSGARGRPTTALVAHPAGPLVLAAAITQEAWRVQVVELGGRVLDHAGAEHGGGRWAEVGAAITAALCDFRERYAGRPRALGLSVPGTISPGHRLDAANLAWRDVDLGSLWPDAPVLVARNDATLAASAESRRGAAVGATVALHLRVEAGLGGAVVDHGTVLIGARGAAGEFGHMPFGDPAVTCPCGASGCWGTAVDGSALARLLGRPTPRDQISYARRLITAAHPSAAERAAVRSVATALGRGVAGLVNGIDADLVTLGGLGVDLLSAAGAEVGAAYRAGLMAYRRDDPPPIVAAALGDDGPIAGAAEEAWSSLLVTLG